MLIASAYLLIQHIQNKLQIINSREKVAKMITAISQTKNSSQSSSKVIRIHNYSYYTDRIIGSGNFSTVFEAFSHTTHDKIAAKIVKMSSLTFKKLEQLLNLQIQILLTLNHINTIKCYDVLKTLQQCYIFTQFCDGGTLDHILKQRGSLNEDQAWPYIKGIYEGLKYLSSKNIIHRDLKPANIFLKGDTVKIADFGFAIQARENFKDMNIGSPYYMAPEAFIDNIYGSKTDVWSFGIILYELLHGKTPFFDINDGESLKSRILIPIKRQDFKPQISYELRQLILRCLQIDESKRISMNEIQNSYFMKKKTTANVYAYLNSQQSAQLQPAKNQVSRYGSQKIIRIPSRISIKNNADENFAKQATQPSKNNYYEMLKIKSHSNFSLRDKQISSSIEAGPESPYLLNYRPTVYRTSVYQLKDDIKNVKIMTYGSYLRQYKCGGDNLTITIK